ncbi:hypothetical protein HZF05_10980 [Sphingomonas sp. CGMCC 1.13654]|uniref:Uncharacterized protein n=1 Tax=Sphingomonas chungangi TaxID=2683589 RepID=A0A838LAV3_9SPHN|nr:hypothetical protein [Sphingomonas chungangi]MBA2934618.1 hypothetical protein [Sphingomonas chungangi]MVW57654.1 hypothetical protein [Sphingomonas chungangi]
MERAIRTFKLRVSPEGFEVLASCHHRLMTATNTLIPYGATLTAAMEWLAREPSRPSAAIQRSDISELSGSITLFVGAPRWVSAKATEISSLLEKADGWGEKVSMGEVYLLALYAFSRVSAADVASVAEAVVDQ